MRVSLFCFLFFICACTSLSALSDEDLLKKVDSLASYTNSDFQAKYTIVQKKAGQNPSVTVAGIFRRDAKDMYVIIIMEPEISRGQGYLKMGGTLWFYDPESKVFNSTSSKDRFRNSNASNSDFTRSTLAKDYKVEKGSDEKLGSYKCRVLSLSALTDEVTYPKMKVWVSDDGLVRKTEDYSLSGQLLRTTAIPDYYKIGSRFVPKKVLIVDEMRGAKINGKFIKEQTQITIENPSFEKIDNGVFSKDFLSNVSRGSLKQ